MPARLAPSKRAVHITFRLWPETHDWLDLKFAPKRRRNLSDAINYCLAYCLLASEGHGVNIVEVVNKAKKDEWFKRRHDGMPQIRHTEDELTSE